MDKVFTATLKGGISSDVYFSLTIESLNEKLKEYGDNVLYIFDSNTENILSYKPGNSITLPPGESEKKWESIDLILKKAVELSLARDSVFIAVGGGVICDMTAFAASIYMRGARVVLVPTTLLSMVDASVGGKTAIDYMNLKNFVGTFYPAEDILICLETLNTLSEKEYVSGLGEVVKHAFLATDDELYTFMDENCDAILNRNLEAMSEMVKLSLFVKKHFIELDPEEKKGIRSFLNLGHTFGHALETISEYGVSHGEGVAWGMGRAFEAGLRCGCTSKEYFDKANALIAKYSFDLGYKVPLSMLDQYMVAIKSDKKKSSGSVKYVLIEDQGKPVLSILPDDVVRSVVS